MKKENLEDPSGNVDRIRGPIPSNLSMTDMAYLQLAHVAARNAHSRRDNIIQLPFKHIHYWRSAVCLPQENIERHY